MEPFDTLRQLMHPEEFRIPRSVPPAAFDSLLDQSLVAAPTAKPAAHAPIPASALLGGMDLLRFLVQLATGLWRLRQKMLLPGSTEPLEEMRRAWRHFESVWDQLKTVGLDVQDHTGEAYHAGSSLHVVAFQPTDGVTAECISETIRPTIYFRGQLAQTGEVIVSTPPSGSSPAGANSERPR